MPGHRTAVAHPARRPEEPPVTLGWTAAGLALVATSLSLSMLLPSSLVLLVTGCVLATAGFVTAAALFLRGRRLGRDATAGWDLASALVFLGFAAVLLTDMGEAVAVLTAPELR
jgi:hypothetical protein